MAALITLVALTAALTALARIAQQGNEVDYAPVEVLVSDERRRGTDGG